ncbi:LacI family DNA-binding transcriptional regulator [Streptomyces meridianus]|uniref:LacI family DNA-binding transcriptional regulator n=1 Tax=Streptomyces meridianus TaxID=2938945 RepID=A0ABT0XDL3_9ACTN|nr:LacI family DNA-binding transcriptional regulator [Streptomyces meridianus]MCM2580008.1 LacI family DNA-binding transcriptional regulator [Streptomyces meridianus]
MPASSHPSPSRSGQVTMAMVATRAGVSTQTVSNALNTPELLRPETLERVLRTIDEMGYRPHRAARSLRTRTSRLIGYGIRSAASGGSSPILDRFLHALSATADEAGYRILLFASPAGPDSLAVYEELLGERGVDAFVLSDTHRGDRRQRWLDQRGIPFVAFGRVWSGRETGDWVDVDGAAGTDAAVEHLAALGHRSIAFLGWPRGSGAGDDRAQGWLRAMRRHGLPVRGRRAESTDDVPSAAAAAVPLLDAGATAVVTASDTLALGCYRALGERGAAPGREVSVTGFDDSPAASLVSPGLTSIGQPLEDVGRECIRLLLGRVEDTGRTPERVLLAPSLVVRDSTFAPL